MVQKLVRSTRTTNTEIKVKKMQKKIFKKKKVEKIQLYDKNIVITSKTKWQKKPFSNGCHKNLVMWLHNTFSSTPSSSKFQYSLPLLPLLDQTVPILFHSYNKLLIMSIDFFFFVLILTPYFTLLFVYFLLVCFSPFFNVCVLKHLMGGQM